MNYEKSFKKYIKNCIDSKVLESQDKILATCMLYRFDRNKQDLAETNIPMKNTITEFVSLNKWLIFNSPS